MHQNKTSNTTKKTSLKQYKLQNPIFKSQSFTKTLMNSSVLNTSKIPKAAPKIYLIYNNFNKNIQEQNIEKSQRAHVHSSHVWFQK